MDIPGNGDAHTGARIFSDIERMERLRAFGLSEYASRAYLALLNLGATEARDVSRRAKIPLAKVYAVLEHLQARGLAVIEPTSPKRYSPVPFPEFLERLRERHLQDIRELQAAEAELAQLFEPAVRIDHVGDRGGVRVLKGRRQSLQVFRGLLSAAQRDVLMAPPMGWTTRRAHSRALFEEAHARGVGLRMLLHLTDEVRHRLDEYDGLLEMRERAFTLPGAETVEITIFDGAAALITHFLPDDGSTSRGEDVALLIDEAGIVRGLACHLEASWEAAPPAVLAGSARIR